MIRCFRYLIAVSILSLGTAALSAFDGNGRIIGEIRFEGLVQTKESVVTRTILNRVGSAYSEDLWAEEKERLMDLDLFASVALTVDDSPSGAVLTYRFTELPRFLFFPAMRRTDQDGLLMGPGVVFMNLFGLGVREELMYRTTVAPEPFKAKEALSWTHVRPSSGVPVESDLTFDAFNSYNDLKRYDERSVYGLLNMMTPKFGIVRGIAAFSTFTVKHDDNAPYFVSGSRRYRMFYGKGGYDFLPSAGAGLIIDTRERLMNPHRGFYLEGRYTKFGERLGGDGNFSEYLGDFRAYFPITSRQILHLNALGRYRPGDVPAYEFIHVGGVNSLRTYSPDADRFSQHELLATAEYRFELFARRPISLFDLHAYYGLQIIAGTDCALEWRPEDRLKESRRYYSFYAGLHILTPALERIRLEFGFNGLDFRKKEISLGFSFGWYEKSETQRRRVR
jgi:outer membrane protein assembly factor BamA